MSALCLRMSIPLLLALAGCPGPNPILPDSGDLQRAPDSRITCPANNDGVIDISEMAAAFNPGTTAEYRVNPPGTLVDVDVVGKLVDGQLQWEFTSVDNSNLVTITVEPVSGSVWYAKYFPTASFAVGSDATANTLQVFRLEGNTLLLLGLASRKPDFTLLVYDKPVASLRFPLKLGDSITSKSNVNNGKLNGVPIATEDTYEVKVDAIGSVKLPYFNLQNSLRVLITVTSSAVGGVKAVQRQAQWFHECYGEVARAIAQRDEPNANFTKAVELRRLASASK